MPNYDYECRACGAEEELNVSIEQRDMQKCYSCGKELRRKIVFYGSVWAPTAGGMR